jgi:hypothetical protein
MRRNFKNLVQTTGQHMADVERDPIESSRGELATARMRHCAARRWCDFATGPPQCRRAAA